MNPNIERLIELLKIANAPYATVDAVAKLFQAILRRCQSDYAELERKIATAVDTAKSAAQDLIKVLRQDFFDAIHEQAQHTADLLESLTNTLNARMDRVEASIAGFPDLSYLERGIAEAKAAVADIRFPEIPKPEPVTIDKILGLRAELDALEKRFGSIRVQNNVTQQTIAVQRGGLQYYDLSPFLNGSLKTFMLPAFSKVVLVQSTSTPNAFRPFTDYTTDATNMSITFTSEIDETTTLAAGQSVILLYVEP